MSGSVPDHPLPLSGKMSPWHVGSSQEKGEYRSSGPFLEQDSMLLDPSLTAALGSSKAGPTIPAC